MTELTYWNNWQKPYRILFIMLLVLLAGSILYFVLSLFFGASFVIDWVLTPALEAVKVPLSAWQHPLLDVQVTLDTYVVKQTYWGSTLQVNKIAAVVSLLFFLIAMAVVLASLTTLSRLWFIVSMAAFCGVIVLLRLEQLGIAGRFDNTFTAAVFILLLPLAYYFHAIRSHTSFLVRLLVFAGVIALLTIAGGLLATVPNPVLYVLNYGMPAWLALSFLLLVLVGPEIIVGILYLVTATATPGSKGSLRHFTLASALYLLNLILYYLQERQYLDWDIFLIGPYWILILSLIAGLWTLRLRQETLSRVMVTEPYGLFLYLALGTLTLSTMAYAAATANNPYLETFEDAILYTHLGMGSALFLYIIANFYGLLRENQRVYKVLYRPQLMPLFTARLAGLIIIVAFFVVRGNYPIFQAQAAYYNGLGDIYAAQGDLIVSQNYYRLGSQYQVRNHRSNYALASLAMEADQPRPALLYLKEAAERQPTPYAFANLANIYRQQGLFFDALFVLRQGVQQFPLAGQLYNNLGLFYGTTGATDSAFYYLKAASADDDTEAAALTNMLAVLAQRGVAISPDSLLSWDTHQSLPLQNNLLAMANRHGYRLKGLPAPAKVLGNDSSMTAPLYLLNYALQTNTPDTALISRARRGYENALLSVLEEQWGMAYAQLLYNLPNYYDAFAIMQDLAYRSQFNNITYYKILGQWALEQGAPLLAAESFKQAQMRGDVSAGFYHAMALAEAGQPTEAAQVWVNLPDSLLPAAMRQRKTLALTALSETPVDAFPQPEELALLRLRLRAQTLIPAERNALLSAITKPAAKAEALLHLTKEALKAGERAEAQQYLARLQEMQASLSQEQQQAVLALRYRYQLLAGNKSAAPEPAAPLLRLQKAAALQLAEGNVSAALELLQQVAAASPFEEGAILQAVQLLNAQKKEEEAYAMLRRALFLNKYSVPLLEAYALQSLKLGLDTYAEETLLDLELYSPLERYKKFLNQYEKAKTNSSGKENW